MPFLRQAMAVSDNVVFLCHVNAYFTTARVNAIAEAGFDLREIAYVARPSEWASMGLQLAAVHIAKRSPALLAPPLCIISRIEWEDAGTSPRPT